MRYGKRKGYGGAYDLRIHILLYLCASRYSPGPSPNGSVPGVYTMWTGYTDWEIVLKRDIIGEYIGFGTIPLKKNEKQNELGYLSH